MRYSQKKHDESREIIPAFFQTSSRFFPAFKIHFFTFRFFPSPARFPFPFLFPFIYIGDSKKYITGSRSDFCGFCLHQIRWKYLQIIAGFTFRYPLILLSSEKDLFRFFIFHTWICFFVALCSFPDSFFTSNVLVFNHLI